MKPSLCATKITEVNAFNTVKILQIGMQIDPVSITYHFSSFDFNDLSKICLGLRTGLHIRLPRKEGRKMELYANKIAK